MDAAGPVVADEDEVALELDADMKLKLVEVALARVCAFVLEPVGVMRVELPIETPEYVVEEREPPSAGADRDSLTGPLAPQASASGPRAMRSRLEFVMRWNVLTLALLHAGYHATGERPAPSLPVAPCGVEHPVLLGSGGPHAPPARPPGTGCAPGPARVKEPAMSTPQDPARRLKQKRRRSTQLAAWRAKQEAKPAAPATEKPAKAPAAKA
ncbi:MAG: hypothetical protein ACLQVI_33300 [Polyangiaceae bacterium]